MTTTRLAGFTIAVLLALTAPTYAQLAIDWSTIDGGGFMFSTGGGFELGGTIGQPDAGVMTGGGYTLYGGFWAVAVPTGPAVCLGDMNCDGVRNFSDIDPFVLALQGQAAYLAQFPACNWLNGDINADTTVNFSDIDPFVGLLGAGACP